MKPNKKVSLKNKNIFVIDDDPLIRRIALEVFQQDEANVCCMSSGEEALQFFEKDKKYNPNVILLDVVMKGMDGFQTCQQIKKLDWLSDTPIVFLTAHENNEAIQLAYDAGATDFITKPINWENLRHYLCNVLNTSTTIQTLVGALDELKQTEEGGRAPAADHGSAAGFEVDLSHGEIVCSNKISALLSPQQQKIKFTLTEFAALFHPADAAIFTGMLDKAKNGEGPQEGFFRNQAEPEHLLKIYVRQKSDGTHPILEGGVQKMISEPVTEGLWQPLSRGHQKLAMESRIETAIQENQLVLHFQPKISIKNKVLVGAEALVRWESSAQETLYPDEFLPVAETSFLIERLDTWVLKQAFAQIAAWQNHLPKDFCLSINVSRRFFTTTSFVDLIANLLEKHQLTGELFEFEVTETAMMEDFDKIRANAEQLRAMGAKISIDDFGSGYSSFTLLHGLPINELKIDKYFISKMLSSKNHAAIVKALVHLSHALSIVATAEGVETKEQEDFLSQSGCDFVQGFLYSKPVSSSQLEQQFFH